MHVGQVVHLRGFAKGEERAHVIVSGPSAGRVKLTYCGQERWYEAKWYAVEFIITEVEALSMWRAAGQRVVNAFDPMPHKASPDTTAMVAEAAKHAHDAVLEVLQLVKAKLGARTLDELRRMVSL